MPDMLGNMTDLELLVTLYEAQYPAHQSCEQAHCEALGVFHRIKNETQNEDEKRCCLRLYLAGLPMTSLDRSFAVWNFFKEYANGKEKHKNEKTRTVKVEIVENMGTRYAFANGHLCPVKIEGDEWTITFDASKIA